MESEYDEEEDDNDDPDVIVSPSKLTYSLTGLDERGRDNAVDAFSYPQMTLKVYAPRDQHVVFQVAELSTYNIQTGAEGSPYAVPACTCGCDAEKENEGRGRNTEPCRHLIWLFDQMAREMLIDDGRPLTMTRAGHAAELGNPFERISDFHEDVLADSLHCNPRDGPSSRRVQETREMLASLNNIPTEQYRPDLLRLGAKMAAGREEEGEQEEEELEEGEVVERRDLEATIFRMLLRNDEFFSYFLSSMPRDEPVHNRFRRLEQRAAAALAGLDAYTEDPSQPGATSASGRPKDVQWCAAHLALVLDQIYASVQHAREPLEPWEQAAAARAAVHVLEGVVERAGRASGLPSLPRGQRDLYFCLMGDRDRDFAIRVLNQFSRATLAPWADRLAAVEDRILQHGAPASYVTKLRSLIDRLQDSGSGSAAGAKRSGQGSDRAAKRMK